MDVITLLSKAHAEFRKLRSGEVGDNLRSQGIEYKIIWGLESYRLKAIAELMQAHIADQAAETPECDEMQLQKQFAEALWQEDVRESKMLATRLYPSSLLCEEKALELAAQARYVEIADQLCMHLFSRTTFAHSLAERWKEGTSLEKYMTLQLALRLEWVDYAGWASDIAQDQNQPLWLRSTAQRVVEL